MLSPSRARRTAGLRVSSARVVIPPAQQQLFLASAGSVPMPALQPGECGNYTGQGGQNFTCCKSGIFGTVSCFTYHFPGGRRRRSAW